MRWELRVRAAERGIGTAAGMRRCLAAAGLTVSAGKMSHLWSGQPVTVRLADLEVICTVLACTPSDLLVREPATAAAAAVRAARASSPAAPPLLTAGWGAGRAGRLVPPL
ncbi:helix-turn-helix domain-containing protein [Streptomyces sp. H62]